MKAIYPAHNKYKPSGYNWMGDVPSHWAVEKLGNSLRAVSEKNRSDLPLLSITREKGVIERDLDDEDSNHNFIPDDLSGYKVLRAGQFGINKMKAWQGSYGISLHTGIVSPAYFIFDFTKEIDPDFFNRAIRSRLYVSFFGSASDGVRIGQWDLNKSRMREIPLLIPPLLEQRAIASFLNDKCATIDEAVKIKEDQITLLRERRQIIIQDAVTRGLDSAAPRKDSGIDWLSQIPAHWSVKRQKHLGGLYGGITGKAGDDFSKEHQEGFLPFVPFVSIANFSRIPANFEYVRAREDEQQNKVKKGDLLFLMSSETEKDLARSSLFNLDDVQPFLNSFCKGFRPDQSQLLSEFLSYLLMANEYREYFSSSARGFTRINLKQEYILNTPLLLPPMLEQRDIAAFLDEKCAEMDEAAQIKKKQIAALKEYKTSLINAAVTGKIKVV